MEENDIELIDQYLRGELSETEAEEVRQRLVQEKDFAQLYEDLSHIQKGLEQVSIEAAWEVIQQTESELADSGGTDAQRFNWKLWLSVAASLVLVAVTWVLLLTNTTPEKLYAEYFEVYPNVEAPIYRDSAQADSLTVKDLAFRRYADEDYDMAIELFESIVNPDEGTRFYLGMSYLTKGEAKKAATIWEPLSKEAVDYKTQVQWYLALAWLKLDEVEKARQMLEILANSGTAYEERSKAILKAL